jgi:hypothetical protein
MNTKRIRNLGCGNWKDVVGESTRGQTPSIANNGVGAKQKGDQFCYSTKIFIPFCFALFAGGEGRSIWKQRS